MATVKIRLRKQDRISVPALNREEGSARFISCFDVIQQKH